MFDNVEKLFEDSMPLLEWPLIKNVKKIFVEHVDTQSVFIDKTITRDERNRQRGIYIQQLNEENKPKNEEEIKLLDEKLLEQIWGREVMLGCIMIMGRMGGNTFRFLHKENPELTAEEFYKITDVSHLGLKIEKDLTYTQYQNMPADVLVAFRLEMKAEPVKL